MLPRRVQSDSTAIVVRSLPSSALVQRGEDLLVMLTDPEAELSEMHALVDEALQRVRKPFSHAWALSYGIMLTRPIAAGSRSYGACRGAM